jgi:hypothetical protein
MPRKVIGDPLTGSLPRTHLVVPQAIMGPVRKRRPLAWPAVPDPSAVTMMQMIPGRVAYVRTRFGIRRLQIRLVAVSRERPNKGRHYFVGHNRKGRCRSYWLDRVMRVESARLALGPGKEVIKSN